MALDMGAFAHMDFRCDCGRCVFRYPDWWKDQKGEMVTLRFQSRATLQAPAFVAESRCFFVSRKPAFSENEQGSITHLPHF